MTIDTWRRVTTGDHFYIVIVSLLKKKKKIFVLDLSFSVAEVYGKVYSLVKLSANTLK